MCPSEPVTSTWVYRALSLSSVITIVSKTEVDAEQLNEPVDMDIYFIVTDKCTECKGFHEEPQCAAVCPVDCCVDDEKWRETETELLSKKDSMHL